MRPDEYGDDFFQLLLVESYSALPIPESQKSEAYEVSAHMIRIEANTHHKKGRPAPEGIHRDGYRFGSIHLMQRKNILGAENHIYDLNQQLIDHTTLQEPMDSIYFNDEAIYHGVSPFEAKAPSEQAIRDMLILLYQPLVESPQKEQKEVKLLRRY